MNTTYLIVAIEHDKPLPEKLMSASDVVCQRLYQWSHAGGVPANVRATPLAPSSLIDMQEEWERSE